MKRFSLFAALCMFALVALAGCDTRVHNVRDMKPVDPQGSVNTDPAHQG